MISYPPDYVERVYAGVIGKLIGVYLGRPIEGWPRSEIERDYGFVDGYLHESRNVPLVVADDDITGTFTFIRALEDFNSGLETTAKQIGDTWLNYIIENKTILWWGGLGVSTEHTAFLRLKNGISAPDSGSMALNSKIVSEQIGAQIFIDGWGMVCPGDPEKAADLAEKAARVSHDGEAVFAAQVIAAMEAAAFFEKDLSKLLDLGLRLIPADSLVNRLIGELREFRVRERDWRAAMTDLVEAKYGYDKYGGNCHVIPNHALIILALLYGDDNFSKSLGIVNTCGWDTDCNSGNVGCLLGIKNGLSSLTVDTDWRGAVQDRLFLPTAEGGSCITDAVTQTYALVNRSRRLTDEPPICPKNGARFHFSLPGSVQGWQEDAIGHEFINCAEVVHRDGMLAINFEGLSSMQVARVSTHVFATLKELRAEGYGMFGCPTLYPGQTVQTTLSSGDANSQKIAVRPYIDRFKKHDRVSCKYGPSYLLSPGETAEIEWKIPDLGGYPVLNFGFEISGLHPEAGQLLIDSVDWGGSPTMVLGNSTMAGIAGTKQWVEACTSFATWGKTDSDQAFVAVQNVGRGLAICGTRDWIDYRVSAKLDVHVAKAFGIAARVQGLNRYYGLLLVHPNQVRLIKVLGVEKVLQEKKFHWDWNQDPHSLALEVEGRSVRGFVDGELMFAYEDEDASLSTGGIGIVVEEGRVGISPVAVLALSTQNL